MRTPASITLPSAAEADDSCKPQSKSQTKSEGKNRLTQYTVSCDSRAALGKRKLPFVSGSYFGFQHVVATKKAMHAGEVNAVHYMQCGDH